MPRYAVTISFYFDAKCDLSAINKAQKIAMKRKKKYDDNCSVDEIVIAEFGKLKREKIYPKNN